MRKARVTPRKMVTMPRMELQAAVVSVKVSNLLNQELDYDNIAEYFWTYYRVILGYIGNDARCFHVFVANCVQRICDTTKPEQWEYVATEENPADHSSRGLSANELVSSNWFTGPTFMWEMVIPEGETAKADLAWNEPEVKKVHVHATRSTEAPSILNQFEHISDWSSVVRAITLLQQFISRKRTCDKTATKAPASEEDRQNAEKTVIKIVQHEAFAEEVRSLKENIKDNTPKTKEKSPLCKLDPFLDKQEMLRVGDD